MDVESDISIATSTSSEGADYGPSSDSRAYRVRSPKKDHTSRRSTGAPRKTHGPAENGANARIPTDPKQLTPTSDALSGDEIVDHSKAIAPPDGAVTGAGAAIPPPKRLVRPLVRRQRKRPPSTLNPPIMRPVRKQKFPRGYVGKGQPAGARLKSRRPSITKSIRLVTALARRHLAAALAPAPHAKRTLPPKNVGPKRIWSALVRNVAPVPAPPARPIRNCGNYYQTRQENQ